MVASNWPIILNLLAGSLFGAWFGAGWATRLRSQTLHRVTLDLAVLTFGHEVFRLRGGPSRRRSVSIGCHRRICDWGRRRSAWRRWRRTPDSNGCASFWGRHQARGKPIAGGEPSDNARRLRAIQQRPQLRGTRPESSLCPRYGGWVYSWQSYRRTLTWDCPDRSVTANAGGHPDNLCRKNLARVGPSEAVGDYLILRIVEICLDTRHMRV